MKLKQKVAGMVGPGDGKGFASQKEHDDYHRPQALANLSPEDHAEYDRQESLNKGGDAFLALRGAIPAWKAPAGRVKAKATPDLKYAYQSDRTSTPLRNKVKAIMGGVAGNN